MRVRGRLAGAALTAAAISGGVAGLSANSASASGQNARQSVIVVLNNQDVAQPATPGDLPARSRSFQVTQAPILSSMHSTGATKIQTYSVLDAVAATVTPAEASALAANPAVSAIYPDGVVQIGSPNPGGDSASAGGGSDLASMARRAGAPRSDVAPGGGGATGGGTAGVCSSTPDLAPAGLPLIHAASSDPAAKTAASLGFTGAGVTVGFIADGLNINDPDFIRPSGQHVFVDYKDFTGEGTKAPTDGGEALGVGDLQNDHIPRVPAAPIQEAAGRSVGAHRLDYFEERLATRQHGVAQSVVDDVRIAEGNLEAERLVQTRRHAVQVAGSEGDLTQADRVGAHAQRPSNTGARFWAKAAKASLVSRLWNRRVCRSASAWTKSGKPMRSAAR